MTDDQTLLQLRAADPVASDPELHLDSPMATRVRAAATRELPASAGSRSRAPRLALGGLAAGAAALAAVAIGLNGGASSPPDARAALVQAAERTASFDSGRLTWRMTFDDPRSAYDVEAINAARFQGPDVDVHTITREHGVGGDAGLTEHVGDYRLVGGEAFTRSASEPWKTVPSPRGAEASAEAQNVAALQSADALADLARTAEDVERTTQGDATTFRATIDGADVPGPFGNQWKEVGSGVRLAVTVGDDGAVRRMELDKGPQHAEVTFAELGQPQGIAAP